MDEHEELKRQLSGYVEQPEPTANGDCYVVSITDLCDTKEWDYIEFHFNNETGKLDFVRLTQEEIRGTK